MKKILAFAGSNHAQSINYQLVEFTASLINDCEVNILDIRNWEVPMYSINMDPDQTPDKITELISMIQENDAFVIASPEHNGGTPAFFKNILDWLSRRAKNVFDNKPVLLMSTSPGKGGGANHLQFLMHTLPYQGAQVARSYSLPSFQDNVTDGQVTGEQLEELKKSVNEFTNALNG